MRGGKRKVRVEAGAYKGWFCGAIEPTLSGPGVVPRLSAPPAVTLGVALKRIWLPSQPITS